MSNGVPLLPTISLVGKRKRKKDPNPNPLFSQWLTEWRDEAKEKGWKSEYIYSKALTSLKKYPLPLSTGKECKILQHFGDKICKMLDDRLLKLKQEQENLASMQDFDAAISSHPRLPATVHEISDASDEETASLQNHESALVNNKSGSVLSNSGNTGTTLSSNQNLCSVLTDNGNSRTAHSTAQKTVAQSSSRRQVELQPKNTIETVNINIDEDENDDVSYLGCTSPVQFASLDSDDDDLPELPRLPDLDKNEREDGRNVEPAAVKGNRSDKNCTGDVGPEIATSVVRVTHSVSDSEEDEAGQDVPPQRPARRGGGRQPREYIPAYRSGPYAILLTLYRQAQDPAFRGFMTKAELCRAAQPLADKSFTVAEPGSRYTAWSSVPTLTRKGYLTKESSPAKYRLTDQGYELAHRLEQVERGNAVVQHQNGGDGPKNGPGDGLDNGPGDGPGVRPENGPRAGGLDGSARRDDDDDSDSTWQVNQPTKKTSGKKKSSQNKGPDSMVTSSSSTTQPTHEVEDVGEEVPSARPEKEDQCIVIKDGDGESGGSDDELPALTLPSLAERLKSSSSSCCSSTALPVSTETPPARQLRYWYVAEDDNLVCRKSQASVEIDESNGASFLVKINYQHLLQSGSMYRLDMTRPLGDDFVFAYLSDLHCYDEAQPPEYTETSGHSATAVPQSAASARSTTAATRKRKTHDISLNSDSETESEQASSKPDNITNRPSSPTNLTGKCSSGALTDRVCSLPSSIMNQKRSAVESSDVDDLKTSKAPSLSSSQDSVGSGKSVVSSSVEDFVLWPGTFDIVLCVDNREFYGSNSGSKSLLPDLIKNDVTCDLRLLSVGDLLWVAREKAPPRGMMGREARPGKRRELVLNYVVERKRMDDLVSSMTGGRLKEQKFRLKHSGLQEKIILIESYGSMQHFSLSEDRIRQGIANTEIIDGFTVKQTSDSKETAAYLTVMTRYLQSHYQNKTLRSCSQDTIRELGIKFDIRDTEQMLMPFDHFNQSSLKNKPLTVLELFAKQLIQLWGMSAEKAKAIVDKYPTPTRLFQAYAACTSEKERESLLATLKYGKNLRNLGIALSRQVAQLYTSKTLT